jgi:hypothetical protein
MRHEGCVSYPLLDGPNLVKDTGAIDIGQFQDLYKGLVVGVVYKRRMTKVRYLPLVDDILKGLTDFLLKESVKWLKWKSNSGRNDDLCYVRFHKTTVCKFIICMVI